MIISAHTLGCKLNYAETSDILRHLSEMGHTVVDWGNKADLYIINTCTVTAIAEKKCRNAINHAHSLSPTAKIVVIGCFAQVAAATIEAIPGVSLVLGNDRKHTLPQIIASGMLGQDSQPTAPASTVFPLQYSSGDRTRTFFKIQDGCDYFCTYCAIPYARGRSRSATVEETVCMARRIADEGAQEVVLTGVNTGTFGQQHGESLLQLLQQLDKVEGIARYRISSIEPNLLTDDIIDFIASSRAFLPHFHIPLQSGSDAVLRLMHRRYDTTLYRNKLEYIKRRMPDACIAADIMAGFNGEDEEEFGKVLTFVDSLPISYLHVFTYSDRPGTTALRMEGKIPVAIRREHTARLLQLSERKHREFIDSQMGKVRPVLWEHTRIANSSKVLADGAEYLMEGWTDNYIRLCRPYDERVADRVETVEIKPTNIVADKH